MAQTINITINPDLLQWAREEAGYKIDEIAKKLDIKPEKYSAWEKTGTEIPLGKLKDIAKRYKRQLAVFLLPNAPEKLKTPKDFRNLSLQQGGLSKEVKLVLRRAVKYQELAQELQGEAYWNSRYSWLKDVEPSLRFQNRLISPKIFDELRKRLKIDLKTQKEFSNNRIAFKNWRNSFERELGIFVFQFPMPMDEAHGFCLTDRFPYVIVLNRRHSYSGRIFTLFHELAHILKHESGICFPDIDSDIGTEEHDCNRFAAGFLVPDDEVLPVSKLDDLKHLAIIFKVSSEVILRRNLELNHLSRKQFDKLLNQLREEYIATLSTSNKKKVGGGENLMEKSLRTRGEMFFNLIMDAFHSNRIDHNTASDILNLTVKHLVNG